MKNKRTNASFYGIAVLSCVLDVFTDGYLIVFACLVMTTSAVLDDSIYNIGKMHCPCTRFCSDGKENEQQRGKTNIRIGENKGADQLRSNCEADQRLCFRFTDSTILLLSKSKISSL